MQPPRADATTPWVAPPIAGAAGSTTLLRSLNERSLLDLLRGQGPASRVELAKLTGLSKPTVSTALATLETYGLVEQSGSESGKPGPAAVVYRAIASAGTVVSVDVGKSWIRGAIADLAGEVLHRTEVRNTTRSAPALVEAITKLIREVSGSDSSSHEVVVVGGPGIADETTGSIRLASIPGWRTPGFLTQLRESIVGHVIVANDVNLAALGERSRGAARGIDDLVLVSIGSGIGCGIISRGALFGGATGAAGELGFIPLVDDRTIADRGGQLERLAAADGIVASAIVAGLKVTTAKQVFALAANGDKRAKGVVDEIGQLLGRALATVTALFDPTMIVIVGGVGTNIEQLRSNLEAAVRDYAPSSPPIVAGELGTAASLFGGITLALPLARDLVFERRSSSI